MTYKIETDKSGKTILRTTLKGKALLFHPRLNKGNAFTHHERLAFGLIGKLPPACESLDRQVERAYQQYCQVDSVQAKSIYLHVLFNTNEVLFYALVKQYIDEVTDKLYTPTVGDTVKSYSLDYRQPRGLFISDEDQNYIDEIFANRTNQEIDMIVVSDGEAILGIGDQGIGGMSIPVAKAAMHVVAGGVSPYRIAPLFIDVGTNNVDLHSNPYYLGLNRQRLSGVPYQALMTKVLDKIYSLFPDVVVHFEDFSKTNARWLMQTYGDTHSCFNDDIQGTAAIVLSAIMTALHRKNESILDQRIMLVGPGAAGLGIMESLLHYIKSCSDEPERASDNLWLVGRHGVINNDSDDPCLAVFAKDKSDMVDWADHTLETAVKEVRPSILIGVSGQGGLFHKHLLQDIFDHVDQPIILPLSNPSKQSECLPQDVYDQFDHDVFMATGSPFTVVTGDATTHVSQCNNLFAFPGIASGMVACKAKSLSQAMIVAVADKISQFTLSRYVDSKAITPSLSDLSDVALSAATGLIESACSTGYAKLDQDVSMTRLMQSRWDPHYVGYEYVSGDS